MCKRATECQVAIRGFQGVLGSIRGTRALRTRASGCPPCGAACRTRKRYMRQAARATPPCHSTLFASAMPLSSPFASPWRYSDKRKKPKPRGQYYCFAPHKCSENKPGTGRQVQMTSRWDTAQSIKDGGKAPRGVPMESKRGEGKASCGWSVTSALQFFSLHPSLRQHAASARAALRCLPPRRRFRPPPHRRLKNDKRRVETDYSESDAIGKRHEV